MLPKQWRNILEFGSKKIFEKYEPLIVDILLFGSVERGKEQPNDLDILIIFKKQKNLAIAQELRKQITAKIAVPIQITTKTYEELFQSSFVIRESILSEGYSLVYKHSFAEGLGYSSRALCVYQLTGKDKSTRMRFYYSLYGRTTRGMLEELEATKYTDTVILCPIKNIERLREYLTSWDITFQVIPVLLPQRLFSSG
ncbi:MAG: hypothetical protein A2729_04235 [Candidatus Buchananbacteria bacterium RIFCSPHIGHO2_01_FULL_39_14]|uniref:Polymerase beta nucleotidyltransferase domain-containing protein n=1 Tax=Candidatus Buchananbacteria bacterium RIFCSPHIGHO2_01_FULL_39_14 TaxID=1797532 RepID=A0A1G1XU61_9BACT|nr:MAG: hypothetical protein A2729_04235 [Candidatus Buchananbacteria bacterium RIFCSPHIGHO2_01_FULL_39_14]